MERKENQRGFQRMMLKGKFFSGCRLSCHPRAKSWLSLLSQKTLRPNTQQIIASARKQSEQLRSGSSSSAQNFVRRVVQRVLVHPDKIVVEVNKSELRALIVGDPRAVLFQGRSDVLRLTLEARFKHCGGEMRLLVAPDLPGQVRANLVPSLKMPRVT